MTEEADYRICWDNTFSHFNTKTVFFGIMIESDLDDDEEEDIWGDLGGSDVTAEEIYEMKIDDIKVQPCRWNVFVFTTTFLNSDVCSPHADTP